MIRQLPDGHPPRLDEAHAVPMAPLHVNKRLYML